MDSPISGEELLSIRCLFLGGSGKTFTLPPGVIRLHFIFNSAVEFRIRFDFKGRTTGNFDMLLSMFFLFTRLFLNSP